MDEKCEGRKSHNFRSEKYCYYQETKYLHVRVSLSLFKSEKDATSYLLKAVTAQLSPLGL